MPPDLALSSILIGSNNPCLELIFMVPKVFKPLKFDSILKSFSLIIPHVKFESHWCSGFREKKSFE